MRDILRRHNNETCSNEKEAKIIIGICSFQWPDSHHINAIHTCYDDRGHAGPCGCRCGQTYLGVNYPEMMEDFIQFELISP